MDADLRYIATSDLNAAFYGTRPVRMIGLHLSDMIGEYLFETVAEPGFDAARSGVPQEFYFDQDVDDTRLRCRCEIKPIDFGGNRKVFLIFTRDVTQEVDLVDPSLIAPQCDRQVYS